MEIMSSASYNPIDIATSFLNLAGFEIKAKTENNDEAFWFAAILDEFFDEEKAQKKNKKAFHMEQSIFRRWRNISCSKIDPRWVQDCN